MFGMTNPRLVGPKRTFKFSLYKLMAMRAASYVCELRPALNVPIDHFVPGRIMSVLKGDTPGPESKSVTTQKLNKS